MSKLLYEEENLTDSVVKHQKKNDFIREVRNKHCVTLTPFFDEILKFVLETGIDVPSISYRKIAKRRHHSYNTRYYNENSKCQPKYCKICDNCDDGGKSTQ